MRYTLLLVVLILVVGFVSLFYYVNEAKAFSPLKAGTIVYSDFRTPWQDDTPSAMLLVGTNTAGNYVVAQISNTSGATSTFCHTYEYNVVSGTFMGRIDSEDFGSLYPTYINEGFITLDNDWFVLGAKSDPGYTSFKITSEGGIGPIQDTSPPFVSGFSSLLTVGDYSFLEFRNQNFTGELHISLLHLDPTDGSFTKDDTWSTGSNINRYSGSTNVLMPNWSDGDVSAYMFYDDANALLRMGTYSLAPTKVGKSWSGTISSTYLAFSDNKRDSRTLYVVDDIYITMAQASAATGHNGTPDVGIQTWDVPTPYGGTVVSSAFLYDADNEYIRAFEQVAPGAFMCYYLSNIRMLWGVNSTGNLTQDMISSEILNSGYLNGVGLPPSTYFVSYTVDIGQPALDLLMMYCPPTVITKGVTLTFTDQGLLGPLNIDCAGEVSYIGTSDVSERGFCYNTIGFPDTSGSKTYVNGSWSIPFRWEKSLEDLPGGFKYFISAYACNQSGTAYGESLEVEAIPNLSSGTFILSLDFEPEQSYSSYIEDLTPFSNDLSYLWVDLIYGCASGSVSVDEDVIEVIENYYRSDRIDTSSKVFDPPGPPDTMYQEGEGEGLPLFVLFGVTATYLEWGTGMLYMFCMMITGVGVGVATSVATGSPVIGALGCGFVLSAGMSTGVVPLWVILSFGLFAVGYFVASKGV